MSAAGLLRALLASAVVPLLLGAGALACGDAAPGDEAPAGDEASSARTAAPGQAGVGNADTTARQAPAYSAVTLAGDSIALADLEGSPVLLNVWATWCAPCRQEIPELQALHEERADEGLRVVGVTVDSRSALDNVHSFVEEFGMTYDIWLDPDQDALSAFNGMGVPLTVLIGPEGQIEWEHLGVLERNDPELRAAIDRLL